MRDLCEELRIFTKKEKRSKKERKQRPVETDAAGGNPKKQDFHSGLKRAVAKNARLFHSFTQARRRSTKNFKNCMCSKRKLSQ